MQTVEQEAARFVRQFLDSAPELSAPAALALVDFCFKQECGDEWQEVGGRAGVVGALVQAAHIDDGDLQKKAVSALGNLVILHSGNQTAAAAAGAVPQMMQFLLSFDAALQKEALTVLELLVAGHDGNQSAAAAAGMVAQVMQLAKSRDTALQKHAVAALGLLASVHRDNQVAAGAAGAVEHMCHLLSTSSLDRAVALEAVHTLNQLCSHAANCATAAALDRVTI